MRAFLRHLLQDVRAAALAAALVAIALLAPAHGAPPAEPLRWKLAPEQGLVYKVTGADAKEILDGATEERTLFAGEIAGDRRSLKVPVGRVHDLIWRYLFTLPEKALEAGQGAAIDETFDKTPYAIGPIVAKGEVKAGKGAKGLVPLETRVTFTRGKGALASARFDDGTLVITALFHPKKGLVASADVQLDWKESEGTPPKQKVFQVKAQLELSRTIEPDPSGRKLKDLAEKAVARALEKEIKPAIERAVYRQKGPEHSLGWLGVLLYAGVRGGLDPSAPFMDKAFDEIDQLPWKNVYSVSLAILALESRSVKRAKPQRGETRARFEKGDVAKKDLDRLERLTKWLLAARTPEKGLWNYTSYEERKASEPWRDGDGSISQFATLALHAAARSGVAIAKEPEVWREIAKGAFGLQDDSGDKLAPDVRFEEGAPLARAFSWPEGPAREAKGDGGTTSRGDSSEEAVRKGFPARGFNYYGPGNWRWAYLSMSGAGVSSLVCVRTALEGEAGEAALRQRVDAGIRDGLLWLQGHLSLRHNWPDNGWPLYTLYSIEKAMELARVDRVAGRDWWGEGAHELLIREKPLGGWGGETWETCLAVLFLTRATAEPDLEVKQGGREASTDKVDPADEDAVKVEGLGLVSARAALLATEVPSPEKRRERVGIAEKAARGLEEERRPILAPVLGRLLGSAYPEPKKLADTLLRELAGERIADEKAAVQFHARWEDSTKLGLAGDFEKIPELRARLEKDALPGLRRAAALALSRLRAFEAIPDLAKELERPGDKSHRGYIHRVLVGTAGRDAGEEPEKWRAFAEGDGKALLEREETRRDVVRLGRRGAVLIARERLRERGKAAVRSLIDGLGDLPGASGAAAEAEALARKSEAEALLKEITGKDFGSDRGAWERYWRDEGSAG